MSKVKKIIVSNLKALSDLEIDFNGCTAIITGGNNKGKSSFLKSLPDRLRNIKPDVILKEGTKEGFAEWTLTTGEKFIWEFNKNKEKLIFITPDDIKVPITKEISSKFFPKTFDIDAFLHSTPKVREEMLQKVAGLDFTEIDKRYKEAYDNRTYINRVYKELRTKSLEKYIGLPKEEVDVLPLQEEMASLRAYNEKRGYVHKGVSDKLGQVEGLNKDIERLMAELEAKRESLKVLEEEIKKGEEWLGKNKPKEESEKNALQEKIDALIENNRLILHNKKADEIEVEIEEARKNADKADRLVKTLEQEKEDMVRNANLPEGFGFSEDGVTYRGYALTKEQLSSSAIYIASLKLASMTLGKVKTLHFDASTLGKKSLGEIEKWAKENDLQLFIERPDYDDGEIEYHIIEE